jgi:hypothetical protein
LIDVIVQNDTKCLVSAYEFVMAQLTGYVVYWDLDLFVCALKYCFGCLHVVAIAEVEELVE